MRNPNFRRVEKHKYKYPVISLCRQCGGRGYTEEFPVGDIFHQKEATNQICSLCQGSGRVVVSAETIYTVLPYKPCIDNFIKK